MESNEQRQAREELIGRCLDMVNQAAELQKTAAEVIAGLMAMNPPQYVSMAQLAKEADAAGFTGGHYPNGDIEIDRQPQGRPCREVPASSVVDGRSKACNHQDPPGPTAMDRFLDAYAVTTKPARAVAESLGINRDSADTYLSKARTLNDERVDAGDKARGRGKYSTRAVPNPPRRSPLTEWSEKRDQDQTLSFGQIMGFNRLTNSITGPFGSITCPKATFQALALLADEGAHELTMMMKVAGYRGMDLLRDDITAAAPRLEAIGIEIVYVGKQMCKIRATKEENSEQ